MADQPNLGYGKVSPEQLDAVNQWMRQQPWYQQLLQSWGQDPAHPRNLSDSQKSAITKAAQANGIIVNGAHDGEEIDDGGNFTQKGGSLLKDIAIGAAIGGLALTGVGAAGVGPLAGLFGGGAGAAGAAGAAGVEGGAGVTAGMSSALPGALASVPALGGAAGATAGISSVGTLSKIAEALRAGGGAIGAATSAAANNRGIQSNDALQANEQNIQGQQAFINELLGLAGEEDKQRATDLANVARNSKITNPSVSPFDPRPPTYSDQFKSTVAALAGQGATDLAQPQTYKASAVPKPTYSPIDPTKLPSYNPSTLEQIGNWAGPAMTGASTFMKLFG